jgi:hypothetical protein
MPAKKLGPMCTIDYLDRRDGPPYASIKIFYRPRGKFVVLLQIPCFFLFFPELLRAQRIIPVNDVGRQGSPIKDKKRAREDGSAGPSRSRPKIAIKSEELSEDMAIQRIQTLQVSQGIVCFPRVAFDEACVQAELESLKASMQSGTFVKRELRSPSPIIVKHSGEVVDLTLDD